MLQSLLLTAFHGPCDAALLAVGQGHTDWGTVTSDRLGALDAFERSTGTLLSPIKWGMFALAYHSGSELPETLVTETAQRGVAVLRLLIQESDRSAA